MLHGTCGYSAQVFGSRRINKMPEAKSGPAASALLQHVDDASHRVMLVPPRVHIGRGVSGPHDIALSAHDGSSSRLHATLLCDDGVWSIEDISLNGTRINGLRLQHQRAVLNDGDYVQIGNTFAYVFHHLDMTDLGGAPSFALSDLPAFAEDAAAIEVPPRGLFISPAGQIFRDGIMLIAALSGSERKLLSLLAQTPGRVQPFATLSAAVWSEQRPDADVEALVQALWRKIEAKPELPQFLFVQPHIGVVLVPGGL